MKKLWLLIHQALIPAPKESAGSSSSPVRLPEIAAWFESPGANVAQQCPQIRKTGIVRVRNLFSKFEPVSSAGRNLPIEGIRGFAAMLVFLVHFRALFGHYAEGTALFSAFQIFGSLGHTGVDLFFILSGYLIYGIVMDRRFRFWRFFTRRAQRLYPTFLVVFALYFAASFMLPTRSKFPSSLPQATLYII